MSRRTRYQQGNVQRENGGAGLMCGFFDDMRLERMARASTVRQLSGQSIHSQMKLQLSRRLKRCASTQTMKPRRQELGRTRLQCSSRITG
jgi:hypothetical protein